MKLFKKKTTFIKEIITKKWHATKLEMKNCRKVHAKMKVEDKNDTKTINYFTS